MLPLAGSVLAQVWSSPWSWNRINSLHVRLGYAAAGSSAMRRHSINRAAARWFTVDKWMLQTARNLTDAVDGALLGKPQSPSLMHPFRTFQRTAWKQTVRILPSRRCSLRAFYDDWLFLNGRTSHGHRCHGVPRVRRGHHR